MIILALAPNLFFIPLLAAPLGVMPLFNNYFYLLMLLQMIFVLSLLLKAVFRRKEYALLMLVAIGLMILANITDALNYMGIGKINITYMTMFGTFVVISALSFIQSVQQRDLYKQLLLYNKNLMDAEELKEQIGGLFQDRYKSEPVEDDGYFLTALRYIHLNPVKAGICKTVSDYKESSYDDYMHPRKDQITDTEFALRLLSRKQFPEFHNEGGDENCLEVQDIKRMGDSKAKAILQAVSQCSNAAEFQALTREKRDWCLSQLKEEGLSVRQIERVTGINRGVVQKA